jgi:heme-degrading monooxygenase HmoA
MEVHMAIEVLIKRIVKQGPQARKVVPLILQLRSLATFQPGYISGETFFNLDDPEDCLVVSRWEAREDWERWRRSDERIEIQKKIEDLTQEQTSYTVYAPMVPRKKG